MRHGIQNMPPQAHVMQMKHIIHESYPILVSISSRIAAFVSLKTELSFFIFILKSSGDITEVSSLKGGKSVGTCPPFRAPNPCKPSRYLSLLLHLENQGEWSQAEVSRAVSGKPCPYIGLLRGEFLFKKRNLNCKWTHVISEEGMSLKFGAPAYSGGKAIPVCEFEFWFSPFDRRCQADELLLVKLFLCIINFANCNNTPFKNFDSEQNLPYL